MRAAMKTRDSVTTSTLKSLLARFSNEEAVAPGASPTDAVIAGAEHGVGSTEAARKQLSLADHQHIIQDEITEIDEVLSQLAQPSGYKSELEHKHKILQRYL